MKWSVSIGRIFGINFRIHVTFFLLLFFIFTSVMSEHGLASAVLATLFICAVFVCVLIHEVGHSLIGRHFGKEARSITLLPIGGVATMVEIPEKPAQEIAMSLVGPLINVVIAGILYLFVGHWAGIASPNLEPGSVRAFFAELIGVNIMLAIFNLIPAFPMDGGRVLRGILAAKMDYVRATSAAVFIGQGLAVVFIFYGVFYNWWLAIIGLFLYMGAGGEKQHVLLRSFLHQVPVSEAMVTDFRSVHPDEAIAGVLERFHHGSQEDFPVISQAGLEGILTRDRILASIHDKGLSVRVSDVMDRTFVSVDPDMPLDEVYKTLLASRKTAVAVVDKGEVTGMVCLDGISRYLMFKTALSAKHSGK
jgi:Zn-dependent protease/CBS domain-containing protein